MKNEHLVPVNIVDLVGKINDKSVKGNEEMNYILRLEAISAYVSEALMKHRSQKPVFKPNTRMFR
jgi:hypothetical protein